MRIAPGSSVSRFAFYVLLFTLLSSCTAVCLTRPVVKIGLVAPFEGPYRYVGYDAIYAARLALREANAAGGAGGYTVELVAYDDQGTVKGARAAARNLTQDSQIVAVIGHFREETTAAARVIYEGAGVPLVVAGTVEGGMNEQVGWLWPLLDHLSAETEKIGVLGTDHSPLSLAGVERLAFEQGSTPPDVDAVLLILDPLAAGETLLALREAGWDGLVAGGPALGSPLFTQVAGEYAAGVLFATLYRWPNIEAQDADFSAAYQSLGPHVPPPGPFALTTYQTVQALLADISDGSPVTGRLQLTADVYFYRWSASGTLEQVEPQPE